MGKQAWKLALTGLRVASPPTLFSMLYRFDWYGGTLRRWIHQLDLPKGQRVLEVGCGPGHLSAHLANLDHHVTAVDRSKRMITAAKHNTPRANFETADALNLQFPDDSFDVVIAASLLNVVQERGGLLHELARVTRPPGIVSALVPTPYFSPQTAAEFASKNALSTLQSAAIGLWAGAARKLDGEDAKGIFADNGFTSICMHSHLDEMLVSVTGTPQLQR